MTELVMHIEVHLSIRQVIVSILYPIHIFLHLT